MFFDDESFARRDDDTWRHKGTAHQPTKHQWRGYSVFHVTSDKLAVPGSPAVPSVEHYDEYEIDLMPDGHHELLPLQNLALSVCVARPVNKDEIKRQPRAQAALQLEWDRLRALRCWDEGKVVEWSTVAQKARKGAATCHGWANLQLMS